VSSEHHYPPRLSDQLLFVKHLGGHKLTYSKQGIKLAQVVGIYYTLKINLAAVVNTGAAILKRLVWNNRGNAA